MCAGELEQRKNQPHDHGRKLIPRTPSPECAGRPAPSSRDGRFAERGFTLVEVIVAGLILVVGVLSLVALVDAANGATTSNKQREAATNLAREVIENAGTVAYDDVTPSGVLAALQARSGLADSSPNTGYTLERRGVTYTVDVEVCYLDDAGDGLGVHATGSDGVPFCASGATGATDDTPGDYRRITPTVTWTLEGETKTARQSSFVMPPSGSDLPVVTTLTPSNNSPITSTAVSGGRLQATTSSIPGRRDLVQGRHRPGRGDRQRDQLELHLADHSRRLVDGDYVIGARGRTGGGSYGPVAYASRSP